MDLLRQLFDDHDVEPAAAESLTAIVEQCEDPAATAARVATRYSPAEFATDDLEVIGDLTTAGLPAGDLDESADRNSRVTVPLHFSGDTKPLDPEITHPFGPWELDERLIQQEQLGAGGMGTVYRSLDQSLGRQLALKVMHPECVDKDDLRDMFHKEARVTAQLPHPSIPPVHEMGLLDDGRPFFTMKEVHGQTLEEVLLSWPGDEQEPWTEFRLLEVFQRVCEAMAYAHARGVIHCDIKPANIMVGAFGEVMVMDWGVAMLVKPADSAVIDEPLVEAPQRRGRVRRFVAGTPAYMPPEQAMGEHKLIGTATDVYALGVVLYEVCARRQPYEGEMMAVFWAALQGNVPPIPRSDGSAFDEALWEIIDRAMRPDPKERFADAGEMAREIAAWREGARRREKALEVLEQAQGILPAVEQMNARSRQLREDADLHLSRLEPSAGAARKEPAWDLQDEARALQLQASLRIVEAAQLAQAALAHAPDLTEAKALLSRIYYEQHEDAVQRRAWDEAAQHEVRLQAHDTGEYSGYLSGKSTLSLDTEPRCTVQLHRYVLRGRQLVPVFDRELGRTPLRDVELPVGSYLLRLSAPDRPVVQYPIVLRRRVSWDGVPPGGSEPLAIELPEVSSDEDLYIPAGWFQFGGDLDAPGARSTRWAWLGGFVVTRHPVTCRQLSAFLAEPAGEPWRHRILRDGLDVWRPDWPAVGVSWEAAQAYAQWLSERTGHSWRLPCELEWEKAARGVDGRTYPWGDFSDGAFCNSRSADRAPVSPAPVGAFATDLSPYGLAGAAGNVREWCATSFRHEGPPVECEGERRDLHACVASGDPVVRGGSWRLALNMSRVCARTRAPRGQGFPDVGFRLVRRP